MTTHNKNAAAGHYCKDHRKGGIQSMTVSGKSCDICGATPTKAGFAETGHKTSAKETVLAWVRSKNPQTMELREGCKFLYSVAEYPEGVVLTLCNRPEEDDIFVDTYSDYFGCYRIEKEFVAPIKILGTDMGLQELLIALCAEHYRKEDISVGMLGDITKVVADGLSEVVCRYDITKNLHQQSEEFYENILPLIPND